MLARLVAVLLITIWVVPALGKPGTAPALAQRIFHDLGLHTELDAIRETALAELEAQRGRIAAGDRPRLRAMVRVGFDPETLSQKVTEALRAELNADEAPDAAAWLAQDDNRRLFDLARDANARCLDGLPLADLRTAATPERDPLVHVVAQGTGAAGPLVRRGALVFAAMLIAGNDSLPHDRRYNPEQVRLLVEAQRASLTASHPTDLRALHCAFRNISTAELAAAADFFASPAGRWLRGAADRAVEWALVRAAEDTARYIVEAFGEPPPPAAPFHTALH